MIDLIKERKILYRLIIMVLVTIPLFALLGGTPFLTFNYKQLSNFLPGIYFVGIITLLFWIINISLILLAERIEVLKKIFLRAAISIALGITLSTAIFDLFVTVAPPPIRIESDNSGSGRFISFTSGNKTETFKFSPADSNLVSVEPRNFKMPPRHFLFFPQVVRSVTIDLIILTLCELLFLYYRKQRIEIENARLRQSNLEAKNNQLKMQLHPHFLFNSLNTLRLLLKKDGDKAEDYLLKLSEMLRFSTAASLHDLAELREELKLCSSYLVMQKVRFGDMLQFYIDDQLQHQQGKLPVYALQLLAENAIKHNAFTNEEPLHISIAYNHADDTITVKNKLQPRKIMEQTTKVGLKNLQERYQLLSNESITIVNDGHIFSVTIKLLHPTKI